MSSSEVPSSSLSPAAVTSSLVYSPVVSSYVAKRSPPFSSLVYSVSSPLAFSSPPSNVAEASPAVTTTKSSGAAVPVSIDSSRVSS